MLEKLGITTPESAKRAVVLLLGVVAMFANPLLVGNGLEPIGDASILGLATLISAFLFQSGLNSAKKVEVKSVDDAVAALTPKAP